MNTCKPPGPILLACYTFPPAPGIGGRRWAKYAKGLAELGHTVHVIHAEAVPGAVLSPWWDDVQHERIHRHAIPRHYPRIAMRWDRSSLWNDLRYRTWMKVLPAFTRGNHVDLAIFWRRPFLRKAEELIARFGIRHVIASGAPFSLLAHAAELKQQDPQLHYTADLRDPWTWGHLYDIPRLSPRRMAQEKALEAFVVEVADAIVAPSPDMIDHLRSTYVTHSHKFHVLPHAVDPDDAPSSIGPRRTPPRRLIHAGTWRPNPDGIAYIREVINAFKTVSAELGPDQAKPVFDIYARPHETTGAEQEVRKAGMQEQIRFHGLVTVRQAGQELADADASLVFVTTETRDFLSTRFSELFHQRIPVIHVGSPGRLSAFIEQNGLGTTMEVHQVATELPRILRGERLLKIDPDFDTRPVLLSVLTRQLVSLQHLDLCSTGEHVPT